MPNKINISNNTYSYTLKKGNVDIALNNMNDGPTNDNGFYNGVNPPEGGYTIYSRKQGFVEDGLVLYLDATDRSSYRPELSGDTIWDLSGNESDATFQNGAYYVSDSGGSFYFDETNDYITITGTTGDLGIDGDNPRTICFAIKPKLENVRNVVYSNGDNSYFGNRFQIETGGWGDSVIGQVQVFNYSYGSYTRDIVLSANTWTYCCVVVPDMVDPQVSDIIIYTDGISRSQGLYASDGDINTLDSNMQLGRRIVDNSYEYGGNLSLFKIYNRALSRSEIQQNFNYVKKRYINESTELDGLEIYLDAANSLSYESDSTNWYNLINDNYTFELKNSVAYNNTYLSSLNVDEYINIDNFTFSGSFSFSVWLRLNDISGAEKIIKSENGSNDFMFYRNSSWDTGKFSWLLYYYRESGGVGYTLKNDWVFSISTWVHTVFTVDENGIAKMYKDGDISYNDDVSSDFSSWIYPSNTTLRLLEYASYADIATFKYYSRVLTDDEIKNDYDNTKERFGL